MKSMAYVLETCPEFPASKPKINLIQANAMKSRLRKENLLEQLAEKHLPSKACHDYLKHFWNIYRDIREEVRCVLEIGVAGGGSLRMWEEFFPNAIIHGIDINPAFKVHEQGRVKVHIVLRLFLACCNNTDAVCPNHELHLG